MLPLFAFVVLAVATSLAVPMSVVEQTTTRPAEGIQDNSFLIEEEYNEGPGVVQHIMNVLYGANRHTGAQNDDLSFVFTQEWPAFSQTHQLFTDSVYVF